LYSFHYENKINFFLQASLQEYIDCEGYKLTTTVWTQTGLEIHTVGYVMPTGQVVIEEELYPNLKYKYNKQMFFVSIIVVCFRFGY
jgi:hypothetical protein